MANIILSQLKTRLVQRNFLDSTYSDSIFLDDCHFIAQDIWSWIIYQRKGNKSWDIWYANTVALQNEYTRPLVTSTNVGADWIESVSITYDSNTYSNTGDKKYIPCRQATIEEIKDWENLLENQDKSDPIYFYSDDSIFIAPEVRTGESGTNRIKLTGVRSIASGSWTTSTTETDIKLPIFMFDVLFYGLMWKSAEHMRRDEATIQAKEAFYMKKLIEGCRKMNTEASDIISTGNSTTDEILND